MTPPFLFIVGRGRSGTTLLQAMFDAHPRMAIPPETHLVAPFVSRRRRYQGGSFDIEGFARDVVSHWTFRSLGLTAEAVTGAIRERRPRSLGEAIRTVFALYAAHQGKERYGDKTPVNVLHMRRISEVLPEARFVHVIRDGRDVTASYLDHGLLPGGVVESAYRWRAQVRRGRRDGSRLGSDRYREVRYEQLVEEPERVLRQLCEFIELRFSPEMLRYDDPDRVLPPPFRGIHGNVALPPTRGLRDWRRELAAKDVAVFEVVAGNLLEELGYGRGFTPVSLQARLAAASGLALFHLGRLRRRAAGPGHSGPPRLPHERVVLR